MSGWPRSASEEWSFYNQNPFSVYLPLTVYPALRQQFLFVWLYKRLCIKVHLVVRFAVCSYSSAAGAAHEVSRITRFCNDIYKLPILRGSWVKFYIYATKNVYLFSFLVQQKHRSNQSNRRTNSSSCYYQFYSPNHWTTEVCVLDRSEVINEFNIAHLTPKKAIPWVLTW